MDAALVAVAGGALGFAYFATKASGRKAAEAEKQLASMREFVANLAENDAALQRELVDANAELNKRVLQLASLFEVGKELMTIHRPDEVLDRIAVLASRLIPSLGCAIRILSRDRTRLVLKAHSGLSPEYVEKSGSVPVETSSLGQVVRLGKPSAGLDSEDSASAYFEDMGREGMTFALSVPLAVRGEIMGVLSLYTSNIHDRTRDEIRFLTILAAYASAALENAELYADLGRANRELSALKEYNENILESITIGLAAVSKDLVITTWNRRMEAITGIARGNAVGRRYLEVLPAQEEAGFGDVLHRVLEEGEILELDDIRQKTPDGREYVVSCRVCPLVSRESSGAQQGAALGAIIVTEDVTVRVSMGERLRRAERLKVVGEFAAGVAHEINNPIGIISACAEHLADKIAKAVEPPDEYLKPLKAIEEEAARCSSIIRNLTVFSRHQELHLKATDVCKLVRDTLYLVESQAEESGIAIEVDEGKAQDIPAVQADEAQLKQVFLNLAVNAIQAMPEGGILRVRVDHEQRGRGAGHVVVRFADTGCGIPRENLDKIFTPFFTTRSSGVGLGLAVSHGIVEAHGGTISVESKEGEGSTFTVRLPATRPRVDSKKGSEQRERITIGSIY
ncbi:MAG: ATP-binding protein [Bacillota bacterium]